MTDERVRLMRLAAVVVVLVRSRVAGSSSSPATLRASSPATDLLERLLVIVVDIVIVDF
jgi:hypothetical protein